MTQLLQIFGRSDDDAAERIIRSCRQASPDLTDDELVFFLNREGRRFLVMPGVTNPLGLLIKHLPKAASGESLRQHREAARSAAANDLAMARDVLADQESPEPLREWAQNILKGAGN